MVLLLNENTRMNGGSGDVECVGMSVDGDGSEGMGNDVDESKENIPSQHWCLEMSARTVQALEIPGAIARTFC
jgi:hypothetical protein